MNEPRKIRVRIIPPAEDGVPERGSGDTQPGRDSPENDPPAKSAAPESEMPDGADKPAKEGMPDDDSAPYEVGYGRPPKAHQFKPGVSGNPKGRPKDAKNLRTLVIEKLRAKVDVREGGRQRRMSKREIGVTKVVNRFAETGDIKTLVTLMKIIGEDLEGKVPGDGQQTAPPFPTSVSDAAMLKWFLEQNAPRSEDE